MAIEFDAAQALFSLYCFRSHGAHRPALVNAMPNRYRLRELEATLVELNIELPESLRRYFLAVVGEDEQERALREREVRPLLCAARVDSSEAREHALAV